MPDPRMTFGLAAASLALALSQAAGQTSSLTSPNSKAFGRFGSSVSAVPDVNGDGRGEMAVGAPNENVGVVNSAGRAYLYSAYGLLRLSLASPAPEPLGQFGFSVSGVADVNGDAAGDIIVGAPFENPNGRPTDSGRAYLFSGASGVLRLTLQSPNPEAGGLFGWAVAGLPDINGNNRGDIAVGAPNENPGFSPVDCGRVYIFNGYSGALIRTLASPNQQTGGGFGTSIAGVGDVNGDGRGDILVGALFETTGGGPSRAGRAYLFSGANGALLRTFISPSQQADGIFGNSVASVPDVNGDGKPDILVGAPYEHPNNNPAGAGRVYLYNGATGALLRTFAAGQQFENDIFGFSVAGVPDLNGDGRGDVIIGAKGKGSPGGPAGAGRVFAYSGANGAFVKTYVSPNEQADGEFGAGVAGLFDTNADGKGDVGVGAPKEDMPGKADAGRVYMFRN